MKTFYIRIDVPETTPDPETDNGRVAADVVALLAAQPDAYRRLLDTEEITRIADGIAAREYHDTVTGIVEDLKRAIGDGEIDDEDGVTEWLEQTVDGHGDVIYTARAQEVLRQSRNDSAYFDDFGSDGAIGDGGIEWSKLAYCALLADVREEMGDLSDWFKCSECNGDVEPEDIKAAAGTDHYPICADCREAAEGSEETKEEATNGDSN